MAYCVGHGDHAAKRGTVHNGFFDVEGAGLRPEGSSMGEKPTLLLLHGGPGADHSLYKPAFSALTDIAQLASLSEELEDDIEDEENDYMELVEYVRMAAIALFQQLAAVEEDPAAAAELSPFMAPDSDDQQLH